MKGGREERRQEIRMRKKSHFGKLISIGNKSLQTAEGGREGKGRRGEEGADRARARREGERAEVSRN